MKKVMVLVLAGIGVAFAKKRYDDGREEQALWAEATDPVTPARR